MDRERIVEINEKMKNFNPKKIVSQISIGLIVLILLFGAFGTIGAGERGVLLQFGAVKDKIFDEGLYIKNAFYSTSS